MANKTHLKIITIDKVFFEGDVESVNLKTKKGGSITFLANHSPFVSNIDVCKLTINNPKDPDYKVCSIGSGLVYVDPGNIKIITDDIIYSDQIDIKRAEKDKQIELTNLKNVKDTKKRLVAEYRLRKAISRIQIYNNKNN